MVYRIRAVWPVPICTNQRSCREVTARLIRLSQPSVCCEQHNFDRGCYTAVSNAAKRATATHRIQQLAISNRRKVHLNSLLL